MSTAGGLDSETVRVNVDSEKKRAIKIHVIMRREVVATFGTKNSQQTPSRSGRSKRLLTSSLTQATSRLPPPSSRHPM